MKINKRIIGLLLAVSLLLSLSVSAAEIYLNTVLESALENNNTLQAAREKLKAAEMQKESAETIMNSKLKGEISWQEEELTDDGDIFTTIEYSKFLTESLGIGAQLEKAELKYYIAELEFNKKREEVLENVIKQYYNLLKIEALFSNQKQAVKEAEAIYQDAEKRFADNLITEAELLRMEINLDKNREKLQSIESDKIKASEQFSLLTGIDTDQLNLKDNNLINAQSNPYFKKDKLLELAYQNRTDYQIQQLNSDLIKADIQYLKAETDPVFSLGGEYLFEDGRIKTSLNSKYQFNLSGSADTRDQDEKYISLKDLQLLDESEWKVTAALSYEFSDGGQNKADIKAAEAEIKASEINLENLESEIRIELSSLLRELELTELNLETAAKNLKRAELEYQSTKNRYQMGAVIESYLISVQRLLSDAETDLTAAKYAVQLKKTEVLAAVENIYKSFTAGVLGGDSNE
jgi:outer membrane protein TolC